MARKKKSTPVQESDSEGEEFGDVNSIDSAASSGDELAIDDPVEDGWVFPIVSAKAKRVEYEAALKEAQLKVNDLQFTVRKLHMKNAELAMSLKKLKKKGTDVSGTKVKLSEADSRISQFAKLFGVMHEPFVPPSALLATRPDVCSADPGRYDSELSKLQGITAELYEVLPKNMHSDLKLSPKFRSTFTTQLSNGRRSLIYQLRSKTAHEIFGQPSKYYAVEWNREDIQDFQSKIKFPGQEGYKKFAPILFPDGKRDLKKLFKRIELTKMLKSILFGPSSLNSKKPPSRVTQGKVWGTKFVTPGAIAFMAILAIFLHSPDKEFASTGAKTNIPYENWFGQFKSYLLTNSKKAQIKELYMWWNGWVFSFEKAPNSANIDDGGSSGMDEANEAINCLDDDFEMPDQQEFEPQDDLIATFDSLAVSMAQAEHQIGESSSGNSRDRLPLNQPAQPSVSSFAPGPSHTHSVELQDRTEIVQPLEEELVDRSQNSKGKGKEKAFDNITEADTLTQKVVAGGKQTRRGRPNKKAI